MKTSVLVAVGTAVLVSAAVIAGAVTLIVVLNNNKDAPVTSTTGAASASTATTITLPDVSTSSTVSPSSSTSSPTTVATTVTTTVPTAVTTTSMSSSTSPTTPASGLSTLKMDVIIMVDVSTTVDQPKLDREVAFLNNSFLPGLSSSSATGVRLFILPFSTIDEMDIIKFFHFNDTSEIRRQLGHIYAARDDIGTKPIDIGASLQELINSDVLTDIQQPSALVLLASATGASFASAITAAAMLKNMNIAVITAAIGDSITAQDLAPLALQPTPTFALDGHAIGTGDDDLSQKIFNAFLASKNFTFHSTTTSTSSSTSPTTTPVCGPSTLQMDVIIMVDVSTTVDQPKLDGEVAFLNNSFLPGLSSTGVRLFILPYSLYDELDIINFFHIYNTSEIRRQLGQIYAARDDIGTMPIDIGASLQDLINSDVLPAIQQPSALVLLASATGGNFASAITAAAMLKSMNITVITAAIGSSITAQDLAPLALQPTSTFALDGHAIGGGDGDLSSKIINALCAPKDFTFHSTTTSITSSTAPTTTTLPVCGPSTLQMDVIIMVDVSTTVDQPKLDGEVAFLNNSFFSGLSSTGVRLFILPYSTYDELDIVSFFHVYNTSEIRRQLRYIYAARDDIGTMPLDIGASLQELINSDVLTALQQPSALVLLASSTGASFASAITAAAMLKSKNITVITAAIGSSITAQDLAPLALQPTSTFALDGHAIGGGDGDLSSKIINALCAPKDFTFHSTTTSTSSSTSPTTTTLPVCGPSTLQMDVIIMVDVSTTVDQPKLDGEVAFLNNSFLSGLSSTGVRLFILPYSTFDELDIVSFFHVYNTSEIRRQLIYIYAARDDIGSMSIDIGASLQGLINSDILPAIQQPSALVLLASATGASFANAITAAAMLKSMNMTVITAAIGDSITAQDLAPLALQPTSTFALDGHGIGAGDGDLSSKIINALCAPKDFTFHSTSPGPSTTPTTTITTAAHPCTYSLRLDLTVFVDVSNDIDQSGITKTVNFLRQLFAPGAWLLGGASTQVAPAAYASFVDENNFVFNDYYSKTDTELKAQLNFINTIAQSDMSSSCDVCSNLNIANALTMFTNDFSYANGARPSATDVVLLFAAGADADMTSAIQTAQYLRQNGTIVVPISIGANINLLPIAYNATYYFNVPNVDSLGTILSTLTTTLCGIR